MNLIEGFRADRRFESLDLLDSAARNHQRKLSQDYLITLRQQKHQEHKLWTAVLNFWRALGEGYIQCIDQQEAGGGGAAAVRKSLPLITGRALRVLTLQLKWLLLRYGPIEPRVWQGLALYQFAENKGFAEVKVALYPAADGESSTREEFLKALVLAVSSTDGLPPLRQQVAERTIAQFASAFTLSRSAEGCTCAFDLSAPKPPARLFRGTASGQDMIYFGAGDALPQLRQLLRQVVETGGVPKDLNLGGTYEKEIVIGALTHLERYWSEKPPARSSERRKTAARITVVPGFSQILDMIDPANSDELDLNQEQGAESSVVENVSDGGYGAIIPAVKSDWIRVGALIGVRPEGANFWGAGNDPAYQPRRAPAAPGWRADTFPHGNTYSGCPGPPFCLSMTASRSWGLAFFFPLCPTASARSES